MVRKVEICFLLQPVKEAIASAIRTKSRRFMSTSSLSVSRLNRFQRRILPLSAVDFAVWWQDLGDAQDFKLAAVVAFMSFEGIFIP